MNPLETNCYVLINSENKGIIFDPSVDNGNNIDRILMKCKDVDIEAIVLTHGHYDHISGVSEVLKSFPVDVYIHPIDEVMLTNNYLNCANFLNADFSWDIPVKHLHEGEMTIGSFTFRVKMTPGHTPGHVSLFYENVMFGGDVLFKGSIGRTDLPGGSSKAMAKTLENLKEIEENYTIYCGHGPITTLEFEKKYNPYLTGTYLL